MHISFPYSPDAGYSPEDAQDLTQGVFLHPEDRVFGGVDPLNCKFRSILLASLRRRMLLSGLMTG